MRANFKPIRSARKQKLNVFLFLQNFYSDQLPRGPDITFCTERRRKSVWCSLQLNKPTWCSSAGRVFRATVNSWLILPALQIPHLIAMLNQGPQLSLPSQGSADWRTEGRRSGRSLSPGGERAPIFLLCGRFSSNVTLIFKYWLTRAFNMWTAWMRGCLETIYLFNMDK